MRDEKSLEIYDVEDTSRGASLQLGDCDTIDEAIRRIRSQLENVSRKI